jgi:hypothetical protein
VAAFNSAGQGASLRDHDEDFARQAVKGLEPGTVHSSDNRGVFKSFKWFDQFTMSVFKKLRSVQAFNV